MRLRPLRWLWGVLPIVAWAFIVVAGEGRNIESDLQSRAKEALSTAGLDWAEPVFSGRDGVVGGKATEEAEPPKASDLVLGTWGVRVVENRAGLIETADAYVWGASLRENRVRLTGFVPNDETRRTIYGVAQATFPGREIQDQTKLARGAPPRDAWLGGVSFALKQLASLRRGNVDLDRTALSIEGEAVDSRSYAALTTALASSLPSGVTLKDNKVRAPSVSPYTWSLGWDGRQVSIGGYVPSETVRDAFAADVRRVFPRATLVDRAEIAAGEPKEFGKLIAGLLPAVKALEEATVDVRDGQVSLAGLGATDAVVEQVREVLKAALAGTPFRLGDQLKYRETVPKPVSPFVTQAEVRDGAVVVTGYVPGETQRTQLIDAIKARFAQMKVTDQTSLAAGAPDGWFSCLDAGLQTLARVRNGAIRLADRALSVTGTMDDEDAHAAMPAELKSAANRACDTDIKVALQALPEPKLTWKAVRSGNELTLDGAVAGGEAKAELAKIAQTLFPNVTVIDRTTIAPAASQKWLRAAETGLKALARLRSGEANLVEQTLVVTGEVGDAARQGAVRDLIGRLPRGYSRREQVALRSDAMIWAEQEAKKKSDEDAKRQAEQETKRKSDEDAKRAADAEAQRRANEDALRRKAETDEAKRKADAEAAARATPQQRAEADRCSTLLSSTARSGRITFDFGSAELQSESSRTLDKLVEIAKSCPNSRIDITGHTDAVGTADVNEALSIRRAEAVVQYLVGKGIDQGRLTATGFGAAKPLAPNTSAANRALNRRIEFEAKPK